MRRYSVLRPRLHHGPLQPRQTWPNLRPERHKGFDAAQYKTFGADADGIVPLLEADWGIEDDATHRLTTFVGLAWPKEDLEENL